MKFNELLKKWEEQNRTAESKQLRLSGKVIKLRYQSLETGIIIPFELYITSEFFELNVLFSDGYFIGICTTIGKQSKVSWAISAMCLLSLCYESITLLWKFDKQSSVWYVNFKQIKEKTRK